MSYEAIVIKSILNSNEFVLNKLSRLLVDTEHKLNELFELNMHHDI